MINYVKLTRPGIILLIVMSGMTTLILEGSLVSQPGQFLPALFVLYLTGGAANALNNYFEKDTDKQISKTRAKRPLLFNQISSQNALYLSIITGMTAVLIFNSFSDFSV